MTGLTNSSDSDPKSTKISSLLIKLSPLLLFFLIFIGSGVYLSLKGHDYAFYQVSASVAILPAIILAFWLVRIPFNKSLNIFLEGARDNNIIIMCLIYLLAGAFGTVLQEIGGVNSVVNLVMNFVPAKAALPALFLISAIISTAMGTSMGTIAAVGPIGFGIAASAGLPLPLTMGAIVGGAMFGDNLSIISDTSIAATQIHGCTAMEKFRNNIIIAIPTMIATLVILTILSWNSPAITALPSSDYQLLHCIPYIAVLVLALSGINVFAVLMFGIAVAGVVGLISVPEYTLLKLSKNIFEGYKSMTEIMILSILIGGLGALIKFTGGFTQIAKLVTCLIPNKQKEDQSHPRSAMAAIAAIVGLTDLCTANNTVSIILSGESTREIAKQENLRPADTATIADLFSCVGQGLIPYGAQILMAGALAGISPLSIVPHVHYCYLLCLAGVVAILLQKRRMAMEPNMETETKSFDNSLAKDTLANVVEE